MGTLYLVATPIGNLEDLSPRALRVLREARLIAAEDTRHTGKLLKHFEIDTPTTSYFEHNKLNKLDFILEKLLLGDVALVSDAGTPAINDPGYELVKAALASGFDVVPIPGPSAPIMALILSGLPSDRFLFLGFLSPKSAARRTELEEVAGIRASLILFELFADLPGEDPSYPLFAFIFLVALGVDYNIFLMARVREERLTFPTGEAMRRGLAATGGVITSAGIVLAGTFSVLAVLPLVALTQIGITVALGVLLDTLVVRSVLVPALTFELGERVWWPSGLSRSSGGRKPAAATTSLGSGHE